MDEQLGLDIGQSTVSVTSKTRILGGLLFSAVDPYIHVRERCGVICDLPSIYLWQRKFSIIGYR